MEVSKNVPQTNLGRGEYLSLQPGTSHLHPMEHWVTQSIYTREQRKRISNRELVIRRRLTQKTMQNQKRLEKHLVQLQHIIITLSKDIYLHKVFIYDSCDFGCPETSI